MDAVDTINGFLLHEGRPVPVVNASKQAVEQIMARFGASYAPDDLDVAKLRRELDERADEERMAALEEVRRINEERANDAKRQAEDDLRALLDAGIPEATARRLIGLA